MAIVLDAAGDGLDMLLACMVHRPTAAEIDALTRKPLRIGLLPSPPLLWIMLAADRISFDLPFVPALAGAAMSEEQRCAADKADGWPDTFRRMLTIGVADTYSGLCVGLRTVSLSKAWWSAFGRSTRRLSATVTAAQRDAAMAADYRRLGTTETMMRAALVNEIAGRV